MHGFVEEIWRWFDRRKRALPWRDLAVQDTTQRAYMVLVSEIMLQQTQVARVAVAYRRFLREFPTLRSLADASDGAVLLAWRGMGYNSRALRLRDAARRITQEYRGVFPQDLAALRVIPGIGAYTAAAVRNFAFGIPTPCLDTNIRRILHRVFVGPERADGSWRRSDHYLLALAGEVLSLALASPGRTTADWHAALMDFGSLVCTKRNPQWGICPLTARGLCKAAYKVPLTRKRMQRRPEPGRMIGTVFVPNRIIRGKLVEELRDAPSGLTLGALGRRVCADWSPRHHQAWLRSLLAGLVRDRLIRRKGKEVFSLPS